MLPPAVGSWQTDTLSPEAPGVKSSAAVRGTATVSEAHETDAATAARPTATRAAERRSDVFICTSSRTEGLRSLRQANWRTAAATSHVCAPSTNGDRAGRY